MLKFAWPFDERLEGLVRPAEVVEDECLESCLVLRTLWLLLVGSSDMEWKPQWFGLDQGAWTFLQKFIHKWARRHGTMWKYLRWGTHVRETQNI